MSPAQMYELPRERMKALMAVVHAARVLTQHGTDSQERGLADLHEALEALDASD